MRQSLAKRLQQVERTIGSVPIPAKVVEAAFALFRNALGEDVAPLMAAIDASRQAEAS